MAGEFEVRWAGDLPGTPAQIWDACTVHTSGWLWPIEYEPRAGGTERGLGGDGGTVVTWEPPRRFVTRSSDGTNQLDYRFDGGHLDYTHRGVITGDYELELDACRRHTAFYYHTLGEYLGHFAGRAATYVTADAAGGVGFDAIRAALGVGREVAVGDRVRLTPAGLPPVDGVVDYATAPFLGVRSEDALYRFFGRDAWGWPVGLSLHLFSAEVDEPAVRKSWNAWLEGVR